MKTLTRRILETYAPELRELRPDAYLRRELGIPEGRTLEEHIGHLTPDERAAAVERLAGPLDKGGTNAGT